MRRLRSLLTMRASVSVASSSPDFPFSGVYSVTSTTFGRCLALALAVENAARTKAALRMFLVRGLGLRSANLLIKHFKEPERAFDSTRDELEALGVPPEVADDLLSPKSEERAEAEWSRAQQLGVTILDILDPSYPPLLREIFDPPIVLYVRGKKWSVDLPQVAIVGTRRPTGYGLNCAERLGEDLAGRGIAVTSGLARGLDAAAHRGALRGGVTYAVFGSGLDFVYPKENRGLADICGREWRDYFRVSFRHAAIAAKFPDTKSNHRRNVSRCDRRRSGGIFWFVDHGAFGPRRRTRNFCGAGQHHFAAKLRTARAHTSRSEARRGLAGHCRRTSASDSGKNLRPANRSNAGCA